MTEPAAAAKPPLQILLCSPRGFCAGVDRAIQIVEEALERYGAPVYVRHEIVHNRYVVERLKAKGAVFVEELDEVPDDGAPGGLLRPRRAQVGAGEAAAAASCSTSTPPARWSPRSTARPSSHSRPRPPHRADRPCRPSGGGRHHGPAARGRRDPGRDVGRRRGLRAARPPSTLAFVTQTTLSVDDTADDRRRPAAPLPGDRRAAQGGHLLRHHQPPGGGEGDRAAGATLMLVVGAPNSSNSLRLGEVAERPGCTVAFLVQRAADIDWSWFEGIDRLGLTAGASAPRCWSRRSSTPSPRARRRGRR